MRAECLVREPSPALILDGLSTAVLFTDADLRVAALNPAAEMLFAVGARQSLGLPVAEAVPHLRDQAPQLMEALNTGVAFTVRELRLHAPSGPDLMLDYSATPLYQADFGRGLLLEFMARERYVQISRDEQILAQHLASREVIRGLAHEIKNPLGGLRGAAQLLERELDRPELREYTGVIMGEADRLRHLVDRLLGPDRPLRPSAVNVHQVLEHVRQLIAAEAPAAVRIERDYDPSIPDLQADREQLIQALINIVRNAVQALGDHGRIRLRTRTQRKFTIGRHCHRLVARIDVIDDGPGIPEAVTTQVFYPMVTTRADGTGLGLSIAQYLVHAHGGLIECNSRPGETVFSVFLPLESPPPWQAQE